jgi:hypothetical protein
MGTTPRIYAGILLYLVACSEGPSRESGLGSLASALKTAPFAITDHALGASLLEVGYPSIAAGPAGYLATWQLSHTVQMTLISGEDDGRAGLGTELAWHQAGSAGRASRVLFDGTNYRLLYEGTRRDIEDALHYRWARISPSGERLDEIEVYPHFSSDSGAACNRAGVCIVVDSSTVNFTDPLPLVALRAGPDGKRLDETLLALPDSRDGYGVQVVDDGQDFVAIWQQDVKSTGDARAIELWSVRIPYAGPLQSAPVKVLTSDVLPPRESTQFAAASSGSTLLVGFACAGQLTLARSEGDARFVETHRGAGFTHGLTMASAGDTFLLLGRGDDDTRQSPVMALEVPQSGVPDLSAAHPLPGVLAASDDALSVTADASGYALLVTEEVVRGGDQFGRSSIRRVFLDGHGTLRRPPRALVLDESSQEDPATAFNGQDFLTVWTDNRTDWHRMGIYGLHVSTDGKVGTGPALKLHEGGEVSAPALASNGKSYVLAWEERGWFSGTVSFKALDLAGRELSAALVVSSDEDDGYSPQVASNGDGYMLVWSDSHDADQGVHALLIDGEGKPIGRPFLLDGYDFWASGDDQPRIAWDGSSYVVFYKKLRSRDSSYRDPKAVWVSPTGQVTAGPVTVANDAYYSSHDVACAPGLCMFVLKGAGGTFRLFDREGQARGPVHSLPATDQYAPYVSLTAAWDGRSFVVVASKAESGPDHLVVQRISRQGNLLGQLEGVADAVLAYTERPVLSADREGHSLISYEMSDRARIQGIALTYDGPLGPDPLPEEGDDAGTDADRDAGTEQPGREDAGRDGGDPDDEPTPAHEGGTAPEGPADAGSDASTAGHDSGSADEGESDDAGVLDAPEDGKPEGAEGSSSGKGGGCTVAPAQGRVPLSPALVLGALGALVLGRRRARR